MPRWYHDKRAGFIRAEGQQRYICRGFLPELGPLIAAAPDLLDACNEAIALIEAGDDVTEDNVRRVMAETREIAKVLFHGGSEDREVYANAPFIVRAVNNYAQLVRAAEALSVLVADLDDLIANSEGVAGLHMNGEVAPWCDLTRGGQYHTWLELLAYARDILVALGQEEKAAPESR